MSCANHMRLQCKLEFVGMSLYMQKGSLKALQSVEFGWTLLEFGNKPCQKFSSSIIKFPIQSELMVL